MKTISKLTQNSSVAQKSAFIIIIIERIIINTFYHILQKIEFMKFLKFCSLKKEGYLKVAVLLLDFKVNAKQTDKSLPRIFKIY